MDAVLNRLHELLTPAGTVYPDGNNLDVVASETLGAGVGVKQTTTGIKLKVIVEKAHVERMIVGSGRMSVSRPHFRVRFHGNTATVRKFKNIYGIKMVAWEPTEPVDEALMQKCVAFVTEVFARN